jgi:hypothetical protein
MKMVCEMEVFLDLILTSLVIINKNCPLPLFCSLSCSWSHPLQSKAHCSLSHDTSLWLSLALAFPQMLLKARPTERSCCAIFSQPASLHIKLLDMINLSWASFVCTVQHFPNILVLKPGNRWASGIDFALTISKFRPSQYMLHSQAYFGHKADMSYIGVPSRGIIPAFQSHIGGNCLP